MLVVVAMVVAACGDSSGGSPTSTNPPGTSAGATTTAPTATTTGDATSTTPITTPDTTAASTTTASPPSSTTTLPPATSVVTTATTAPPARDLEVVLSSVEETSDDPSYRLSMSIPVVRGHSDAAAEAAINDEIAAFGDAEADRFRADMASWEADAGAPESAFDLDGSVSLLTADVLSIVFFEYWYFQGAAHPTDNYEAMIFDLRTGRRLGLPDLLGSDSAPFALSELVQQRIIAEYYEGDEASFDSWRDGAAPEQLDALALTESSLLVLFGRYEVGPGVLGSIIVEVPYEELGVLIDPDGPIGALVP